MFLANQLYPEDRISLFNAYLQASLRTHCYLILDLTQHTNDGLKFRNRVSSTEYPPIVYSHIGDETCEIQLPHPPGAQDRRT